MCFALKENHKTLYDDTVLFFTKMKDMKDQGYVFDEYTTGGGGHGRIETCRPGNGLHFSLVV